MGGAALLVIRTQSMDFGILSSADRHRGGGADAGMPDKKQSVQLFLKTLNPFQVSKCLIYARMAPLSCTTWVDRGGFGQD